MIGNFKNAGRAWTEEPEAVNAHDFPQDAVGKAVPYGIYDILRNRWTVYIGSSSGTPEFAVAALARWWEEEGCIAYPDVKQILILADSGGSNGCRPRMWKRQLQEHFTDRYGLTVTVVHYPTGCSKWNPIEHRLFSQISQNWAGIPLRSFETVLNYIRGTTTQAGLTVRASLLEGEYAKGQKVSDTQMQQLNIEFAEVCSRWNYTLRPRPQILSESDLEPEVFFNRPYVSQDDHQTQVVLGVRIEPMSETPVYRSQINVQRLVGSPLYLHSRGGPITTRTCGS
ncbi:hypothetical protein KSC_016780 [Ktedonobacter sp. SOSP1-52]|nr:hypothetical protein KSC_016780 [Ktedonobacter sp. SOSP1-52]